MTVMLDTNILISAGLFPNSRLASLAVKISEDFQVILSSNIIDELREVAQLKFPDRKQVLERFLKHLSFEMAYTPKEIDEDIYPKIRDKRDYPILASAIIADVDVFITGDKDFGGLDLERPEIMKISEFEKKYL